MNGHLAYSGVTCDHLYPDCPAIDRWKTSPYGSQGVGRLLKGLVDPEGTDICGLCLIVWRREHAS